MAFKSVKSYNEERYGGFFLLRNDGDFADVIFMYQKPEDVLVADVHYIKSSEHSGYVHCCGAGCPACAKGIRIQTKLFIPLYNISQNRIEYFDRTMKFEPQLQQDVFSKYPNPSEYVFRITRHGEAGSIETYYEIMAVGKNTFKPYAQILAEQHATMPEHYSTVCKPMSSSEMQMLLNDSGRPTSEYTPSSSYNYTPTPRVPAGEDYETPTITPDYQPPHVPSEDVPSVEDPLSDGGSYDDDEVPFDEELPKPSF